MTRSIRTQLAAAALALAHVSCASGPGNPGPGGAGPGQRPLVVPAHDAPPPIVATERQTRLADAGAVRLQAAGAEQRALDAAIESWFANHGSSRGYVMLDKPLYQPGETIWFRADRRPSATLKAQVSPNATIRLTGPRGDVVAEKRVQAHEGVLANDFEIPPGVVGGEYTLEVLGDDGYTDTRPLVISTYEPPRFKKSIELMKKAYGPGDTVAAAVEVARATGEPLAKKTLTGVITVDDVEIARVPVTTDAAGKATVRATLPGSIARGDGLLTLIVDDGGLTESMQKRIPILLKSVDVVLYPEGGELVQGLPGRVYLSALNSMGKPADIEGAIVDDRGTLVAQFATVRDGLGKVELTPQPGRSYHLQVTRPIGIGATFPLPAARAQGCGLTSVDDPDSKSANLRVAVACTMAQKVVVEAVLRDKRLASGTVEIPAGAERIVELPVPDDVQGAVRVTVFGDKKAPLAERLVYRGRGRDLKVSIQADRKSYAPRDKVTLKVKTTDLAGRAVPASLGLSVVDDTVLSFADDKTANLITHLYLEKELPDVKIEDPNFYFGDAPEAAVALDLVMGTKGWRKFEWEPVFAPPVTTKTTALDYDGHFADVASVAENEPAPPPMAVPMAPAPDVQPAKKPRDERRPMGRVVAQGFGKAKAGKDDAAPAREKAAEADKKELAAGPRQDQQRRARAGAGGVLGGLAAGEAGGAAWAGDEEEAIGWAPVRVFPVPSYQPGYDGPRTDFRETVYWAPTVTTGADGTATVSFPLNDAITSFRVTAEGTSQGGLPGRGEAKVQSKTPLSLVAKLPTEVSTGDQLELPIVVTNETDRTVVGSLDLVLGPAFKLRAPVPRSISLGAHEVRTLYAPITVVGDGKNAREARAASPGEGRSPLLDAQIALQLTAQGLKDEVARTVNVAPLGFPFERSFAGTTAPSSKHTVDLTGALPRSMNASVTIYPSPLATMTKGTEALLAEPGGCFEQTSATNYPNTMVLSYLAESDAASPETVQRAQDLLGKGYKILSGYETRDKGYEWFGEAPGHEALTAYGIMEFEDMAQVDDRIDRAMIERTAAWLMTRRDGKGGFKRNDRALDSFGRASADTTNGYIMWALSEARRTKALDAELARQKEIGLTSKDPYLTALAANVWLNVAPEAADTDKIVARLVAMQAKDGAWSGAKESITMSGGQSLDVETTALAAYALTKRPAGMDEAALRKGVDWLNGQREGGGAFASTQGTVLSLKALAAFARRSRQTPVDGTAIVLINGNEIQRIHFEKGQREAIVLDDLAQALKPGKNEIELRLEGGAKLPYSVAVDWRADRPASDPGAVIDVSTKLAKDHVKVGEGVKLTARIENRSQNGVPMTLARIGIPGGLAAQTWQLKELKDKKAVDFVETRAREVIVYFRALPPGASKEIALDLMAQIPGTTVAPASSAYLYYTDESKDWEAPVTVTVTR